MDPKVRQTLGRFAIHLDASDHRAAGTLAAPVDHPLDCRRLALEDGLDPPITGVANPAGHAVTDRQARARVAEEHALHPAADVDVAANDDRLLWWNGTIPCFSAC